MSLNVYSRTGTDAIQPIPVTDHPRIATQRSEEVPSAHPACPHVELWHEPDLDFGDDAEWATAADSIANKLRGFPFGSTIEVQLLLDLDPEIRPDFGTPWHFATFQIFQDLDNLNQARGIDYLIPQVPSIGQESVNQIYRLLRSFSGEPCDLQGHTWFGGTSAITGAERSCRVSRRTRVRFVLKT